MRPFCNALHAWAFAVLLAPAVAVAAQPQPLQAAPARPLAEGAVSAFDGVVEAVRQTVVAAQVPGAIVELHAKVGDRVQAGQVLLRIDARAANQNASASEAQVQAARASLDVATREFQRQQQLAQKKYISQAALERAESEFKSAQAQANAQIAQARAARTESGYHVVRAPFAGVVADVPVSLGDMAMPGRPLLTLYDPTVLRVTAAVPQSAVPQQGAVPEVRIELPGSAGARLQPARVQVLPTIDPATHTLQLRADLPAGTGGVSPGMFARLWLAADRGSAGTAAVSVPVQSVVRRAEMTGLYVLDAKGKPVLRQVRLGRTSGDRVEILSGLAPGEQVAADPQAAARVR